MNIESLFLLRRIRVYPCLLMACLVLPGINLYAAQSGDSYYGMGGVITPHLRASLVSEMQSIEAGQTFWVALHFDIIEDWHTYWKNPGDSGNAPRIRWRLPPGFTAGPVNWPYPHRIPVGPLMNYGYSDEAWMLVRMTAPDLIDSQRITLRATAEWLVCQEACIPEEGELSLSLPVAAKGQSGPSQWQARFEAIQQQLPQPAPWSSRIRVQQHEIDLRLQIDNTASARLQDVYFFPAEYGIVEHAAIQVRADRAQEMSLRIKRGDLKAQPLDRLQGVLVFSERLDDGVVTRAFEISSPLAAAPVSPDLWLVLCFALLGGLLLNIMPCVFPILSLKALSIVQTAAQSPAMARRNGYLFTLGVLISFALIAASLLVLRAGGQAIGWGFQLQSPLFVLALAWLIFAMGLLFSGVWSFGESWMGLGQGLTTRRSYSGAFFTGVLAVVVATPCTAPFMGTALGYALAQPAHVSLSVFLCLGLGMAMPWLLISLWPGLSRHLPKPGAWMERVKQLLAFPLYATTAWLLWVLAQQVDRQSLLYALLSTVLIAMGLWLWQISRRAGRRLRVPVAVALLMIAGSVGTVLWKLEPAAAVPAVALQNQQNYDQHRLDRLRAEGRPVLVNFTAAWCITCLVNEKVVLTSDEIQAELRRNNIVYMKADWTSRDPVITRVLEQYGRSGVPLYLFYPPGTERDAIVLPNILTTGIVLQALNRRG